MPPEEPTKESIFTPTHWTQVSRATTPDGEDLDLLIRRYWGPLKIYFCSAFPRLRGDAETWLQDFAEDKMLKVGWLQRADRNRGKFRNFLKTSLRNFVIDRLQLSGARNAPMPLTELDYEPAQPEASSEAFDLMWVRTVLVTALQHMEADCKDPAADQPRRSHIWELFKLRLLEPIFEETDPLPYDQLIGRFQLRSPMEASNMLLTAKRMFKSHLHQVIKSYAAQDTTTAAEIAELEQFVERLARRN